MPSDKKKRKPEKTKTQEHKVDKSDTRKLGK